MLKKGKRGKLFENLGEKVQNLNIFQKGQVIIGRNKLLEKTLSVFQIPY